MCKHVGHQITQGESWNAKIWFIWKLAYLFCPPISCYLIAKVDIQTKGNIEKKVMVFYGYRPFKLGEGVNWRFLDFFPVLHTKTHIQEHFFSNTTRQKDKKNLSKVCYDSFFLFEALFMLDLGSSLNPFIFRAGW